MDASVILDDLNTPQRQAVCAPAGNYLVLAGAGSGKTRVLVHRIAWLIRIEQISPFSILAVTFTNKAAAQMRSRIEQLLGISTRGMWVGTFHALAHRMLRAHWREAQLSENFQILDSEDQHRLIRRVLKNLNLDENHWQPRKIQWFINSNKDEGLRPQHLAQAGDVYTKTMVKIYVAYEDACQAAGLIDFAEILLRAHELLINQSHLLEHYQSRFHHILVDEFQDTNAIQYAFIKLLTGATNFVMGVGDDDQSIYGWRGARIENIHRFAAEFRDTVTFRLEQNYRSTGTILKAANELIAHNEDRFGKELWTEGEEGEPISVYAAFNENDEARFIVEKIQHALSQDLSRNEIAILYRSNAQSRVIEENLMSRNIPYRVYGGLRFFDRAEIKDALAYLRLIANRDDDPAFERIINTPPRGIGEKTVDALRECARAQQISLWRAAVNTVNERSLTSRANNALVAFLNLIDELGREVQSLVLYEQTLEIIFKSGLRDHFSKEKGEKGQSRLDNLDELINAAKQFENNAEYEDMSALAAFLSHAALEAGETQGDEFQECVQLMTLHAAKGLEFPLVFMTGMEEGLFPNKLTLAEPGRLEEERRLCYVGMTRAMRKLFLTHAEIRRQYGTEEYHRVSRFVKEIPQKYLHDVRVGKSAPITARSSEREIESSPYRLGQSVSHPIFGEGVILNYEGRGAHARVQVQFKNHGSKWLVVQYASLEMKS